MKKIMLIDNFDSFTHNLADEFARLNHQVDIFRSNLTLKAALDYIAREKPNLLVFSPGPGHPSEAKLCLALLENAPPHLPIFGVCLGHQCIIEFFGGKVSGAGEIIHGKPSMITHNGQGLFQDIASPMQVGRYHSLAGAIIPDCLIVDATYNNIVMAVHHATRPIYGVQFHPESILTPEGNQLIANVLRLSEGACQP